MCSVNNACLEVSKLLMLFSEHCHILSHCGIQVFCRFYSMCFLKRLLS